MRTFEMTRNHDESGVSGTGKVLEGVVFSDGPCVVRWVADNSPARSEARYDSFGAFVAIHVSPHMDNKTEIRFSDGEVYEQNVKVEEALPKSRKRRKSKVSSLAVEAGPLPGGVQSDGAKPEEISQPTDKKE